MAMLNAQSGFTTDPETGCVRGYNDYEQCRANFFLKQQNQILQQQKTTSAPIPANTTSTDGIEELRAQIEHQKTEIESLKIQQTTAQPPKNNPTPVSPYPLLGAGLVIGLVLGIVLVKLSKSHK